MFYTFFILLIIILPNYAHSTPCTAYKFNTNSSNPFKNCINLPVLNSALHYTYDPTNGALDIAYRHPAGTSKWVAWAINPTAKGMIGSQSLVAYRSPKNGSVVAYTAPINAYHGSPLARGDLSFSVTGLKAEIINDEIIIYALIKVPNHEINQVWQEGPISNDEILYKHPLSGPNMRSMASLNLISGAHALNADHGFEKNESLKFAHAMINIISWGIMMPTGILIAKHVRVLFPSADPAWFYLHVGCQLSAYVLGVTGWAIGLKLTSGPHHEHHLVHRNVGLALFCTATLQVLALVLRPNKDHKYRKHWSMYHTMVGTTIYLLAIFNIIRAIRLLDHDKTIWRNTYFVIVFTLLLTDVVLSMYANKLVARRFHSQNSDR